MKLKCHTDLIMVPSALAGNKYEIIEDNDVIFEIRNEHGELHQFDKNQESDSYYGLWFELEGDDK